MEMEGKYVYSRRADKREGDRGRGKRSEIRVSWNWDNFVAGRVNGWHWCDVTKSIYKYICVCICAMQIQIRSLCYESRVELTQNVINIKQQVKLEPKSQNELNSTGLSKQNKKWKN